MQAATLPGRLFTYTAMITVTIGIGPGGPAGGASCTALRGGATLGTQCVRASIWLTLPLSPSSQGVGLIGHFGSDKTPDLELVYFEFFAHWSVVLGHVCVGVEQEAIAS